MNLFDSSEEKIRKFSHEYAVIIDYPGRDKFALAVDSLNKFERFDEVIYPLPAVVGKNKQNFTDAIGRMKNENIDTEDVLIVNLEKFLKDDIEAAAELC